MTSKLITLLGLIALIAIGIFVGYFIVTGRTTSNVYPICGILALVCGLYWLLYRVFNDSNSSTDKSFNDKSFKKSRHYDRSKNDIKQR